MRKTRLSPVVISCLLLLGVGVVATVRLVYHSNTTVNQQAAPTAVDVSVVTVLQAHRARHEEWLSFSQKATLVSYRENSDGSQRTVEKSLTLSTNHSLVRLDMTSFDVEQTFLFNGQTMVRTTHHAGAQRQEKVNVAEADSIRVQINICGLLPIFKRLSDPGTQVVYAGAISTGHRFRVTTAKSSWYFYTNSSHLIERLEARDLTITYGDYRTVNGLNLPFYQQVRKGDRLVSETRFDTFDFNPIFAAGFFESDLL